MGGVWLVRHGATTAPAGLALGSSDPPLSSAGLAQSKALATRLAECHLSRIFASDRRRAVATAEAIASVRGLRVEVDSRLREIDFGAWELRRLADLWVEEPEAAARWEGDLRLAPDSFGESVRQLEERVREFWTECDIPSAEEVAIVAHRGSLAVLNALVSHSSLGSAFAAGIEVGTATWISR